MQKCVHKHRNRKRAHQVHEDMCMQNLGVRSAVDGGVRVMMHVVGWAVAHHISSSPQQRQPLCGLLHVHQCMCKAAQKAHMLHC